MAEIKAATAAVGTVRPRLGYHSLGGRAKQLRRAVPGRSAAEEASVLSPCRAAETEGGITAVNAGASAAHQPNTGKARGRDCPARREEGEALAGLGRSPFGKSRGVRQGGGALPRPGCAEGGGGVPLAAAERVGFAWIERAGVFGGKWQGARWYWGENRKVSALNPFASPHPFLGDEYVGVSVQLLFPFSLAGDQSRIRT